MYFIVKYLREIGYCLRPFSSDEVAQNDGCPEVKNCDDHVYVGNDNLVSPETTVDEHVERQEAKSKGC